MRGVLRVGLGFAEISDVDYAMLLVLVAASLDHLAAGSAKTRALIAELQAATVNLGAAAVAAAACYDWGVGRGGNKAVVRIGLWNAG